MADEIVAVISQLEVKAAFCVANVTVSIQLLQVRYV